MQRVIGQVSVHRMRITNKDLRQVNGVLSRTVRQSGAWTLATGWSDCIANMAKDQGGHDTDDDDSVDIV